jgi:hypothetical protein
MASGGNVKFANGVSTAVGLAAQGGREWSLPLYQRADFTRYQAQVMDEYSTYLQSQFARHQTPVSFTTFAGGDVARLMPSTVVSQLDGLAGQQRIAISPAPKIPTVTQPATAFLAPKTPPVTPMENPIPKPSFTPADRQEFIKAIQNSVGGPSVAPGGFRTGMEMPYWEDGEWPITPWYGLGYVVNDPPAERAGEVGQ